MPLQIDTLTNAIKTTFDTAEEKNWTSEQVAASLASAIDAYLRSGDVVQVTVQVRDSNNAIIGTGTQTGTGKIQ